MPSSAPDLSTRLPVSSASLAAEPDDRSIGTWPADRMNHRLSAPLIPLPVKNSCLARKVTLRRTSSGMNRLSEKDRWLPARIAGPSAGRFSSPSTDSRKNTRSHGPMNTCLNSQYHTRPPPPESACPKTTYRGRPVTTRRDQFYSPEGHTRGAEGLVPGAAVVQRCSDATHARSRAVPRRRRSRRRVVVPRLHRYAAEPAAVGRVPGRAGIHGEPAAAARPRHALEGRQRNELDGLVRRGGAGVHRPGRPVRDSVR